jgi:DNA-directed RNA polymerase specialized sigma subunit
MDPGLRTKLLDAIERLPIEEQDVINGLFWEQTTRVELGARLGRARGSTEALRRKALASLRDALEG